MNIPHNNRDCITDLKVNEHLSCKFIQGKNYICAAILDSDLHLIYLEHHFDSSEPSNNYLQLKSDINSSVYSNYYSLGLYDTNTYNIKVICGKKTKTIYCRFLRINSDLNSQTLLGKVLHFNISNDFSEKSCYVSEFNSEYLLCCGIVDFIKCFRIDKNDFNTNKVFKIAQNGDNSYLTIKSNNNYCTLFYMNNIDNSNYIYEYYIYLPKYENKNYDILNSLNENKSEENKEKLNKLFTVKTNKYYFEIKNLPDELGYFTLNNEKIKEKILISNDNHILDFIVTNNNKTSSFTKILNYIVSVEDDEEYTTQCRITLNFKACYHSCFNCSKEINESTDSEHNCISCRDNYYPSPENKNNCFSIEEKKPNWYLNSENSEFDFCHQECHSCTGPTENNCTSCFNGFYLDNNSCKMNCSEGYFPILTKLNDLEHYFVCDKCYENCQTCSMGGDAQKMNCETCKENQIKYNDSCFDIANNTTKSFYEPESNDSYITSCNEKFGKYIKEDSNECIHLPNEEEGYYISNNITGLLLNCHDNCLSCKNGPNKNIYEDIQSMECISCKDLKDSQKTMIKVNNNCFKIIQYNETHIILIFQKLGIIY